MSKSARELKQTQAEYFDLEAYSDGRHEYVNGRLFNRAQSSSAHDGLVVNLNLQRNYRVSSAMRMLLLLSIFLSLQLSVSGAELRPEDDRFPGRGSHEAWETAKIHFDKGRDLEESGNRSDASAEYMIAVQTYGSDPIFHCALGEYFLDTGRAIEAEEMFQTALLSDKQCKLALYDLAVLKKKEERYDDACELFRKVLQLDHNDYLSWYGWETCLMKLNRGQEFHAVVRQELALKLPDDERQAVIALSQKMN
jgi:tetratricopeptide (TPR) repeat protein